MKLTILSKCFSKMKRVALTLFAALCVGSVWAEEGEVTTPEVTPEPDPAPSTSALSIDPSAGYILTGLGELGDQVAVVFTNDAAIATWKAPKDLKNIEFLAVGGGGGGGGHYKGTQVKYHQGGAGGGGGGVVTGFIKELAENSTVSVTVGAGGAGGPATTSSTAGSGKAGHGGNTVIKVGDLTYVTAYGGGGDGGKDSTGGVNGGSNSGVRQNKTAAALKSVTVVGAGAEELISDIVYRANKGGGGYSTGSGYPAGGGGGAGGPGGVAGAGEGSSWGGSCGYGYVSMITDQRVVYGAGGGGGIGKTGGGFSWDWDEDLIEGAGRAFSDQPGEDALPNQGGGGGGGSYLCDGGAGGSGVVILRFGYSETDIPVDVTDDILPKISDKVYTGEVLSSGLVETSAYKVEELEECVNVGAKVVRVTLNEGYAWTDGSTERYKVFPWNILKQDNNVWATTPFINVDSWGSAYTSNVIFHQADPLAGEVVATIVKDDGEPQQFNGDLPTEPGVYKLIYKVEETDNHSSLYWEKTFKIYQSETFAGGYKVYGLGDNEDEVAVVFTSTTDWTVPKNLKNVEFLVVGGGGGGGADTATSGQFQGGAGGGGGGVITGVIKEFSANSTVTITVGDGGKAGDNGVNNSGYGAGSTGAESSIALGTTKIVTAKGGGRDAGATAAGKHTDGKVGGDGGSGGGGRPNKAGGAADAGSVDATYVLSSTKYANAGGSGCTVAFEGYGCGAAGGGGGATEVGGNGTKVDEYKGGDGGEGLASDITGARLVYGSGGGGSSTWDSAGVGGTGAGDGVYDGNGKSAIPNQGGGGGGGSRTCDGGNGGSGIVVFRYKVYAAEVNSTPYDTLSEAITAAADGATIKVLNDCTADTACVIANKTLTIDLNGKTVKANDAAAATDGNGVFWVQAGGVLTLEDSSEEKTGTVDGNGGNDYKMAIWADGGKVVINAGNYVNENDGTHTQYDLIYAKNGGEIVINGGTFKCDTPRWTLNSHNTKTGTFVVTGGKFYQYNPTDFDTDEAVTTWCDAKYRAEADGDWYVIKEGYIVTTEPEASAVTVTADTETEALAQVDFSVTTPEGVDATAYKNYFKLVATETAEGSKTWIVALALKDELKPVIAETTPAITFNDDGTVTVNIENELPGLNYGVRYATTVEAVETATPVAGFTVTPAEGDTAGFFKVVVDFKPIGETKTN